MYEAQQRMGLRGGSERDISTDNKAETHSYQFIVKASPVPADLDTDQLTVSWSFSWASAMDKATEETHTVP